MVKKRFFDLLDQWAGIGSKQEKWKKISRFYNASKDGDIATVSQLLGDGTPPDTPNIHGLTPSWQASVYGHKEVVQTLLATKTVDVNVRSVSGHTPLFWSAASGYFEIVQLLLDYGAIQDYTDNDGRSPLSIAQLNGYSDVVDLFTRYREQELASNC